jgi:chromosome partitioning protein
MRVITVANEKGGVGKTTVAVNLAAALGLGRSKVLVIDLDSQGHATQWLGIPKDKVDPERSAYSLLARKATLAKTLIRTTEQGVTLSAAHVLLAHVTSELNTTVDGIFVLREALRGATGLDYVVVDCPGAKGALVFNALVAADLVLAPVRAEVLSLEGLTELRTTVEKVRERFSPQLPRPQILINDYDGRSGADRAIFEHVRREFAPDVFDVVLNRDAPLRECFGAQQSIFRYRPAARSAAYFRQLAANVKEVLDVAQSPTI